MSKYKCASFFAGVGGIDKGFESAGENDGSSGMAFMGMGVNTVNNVMGGFQSSNNNNGEDPYEKLKKLKQLLDDGVITEEEFEKSKKKLLDI